MRLYKVDTGAWTVRQVQGEPWPGKDSEGERTYDNTHFAVEEAAWTKLEREALAFVELAARAVTRARDELAAREHDAVEAALALEKVRGVTGGAPKGNRCGCSHWTTKPCPMRHCAWQGKRPVDAGMGGKTE